VIGSILDQPTTLLLLELDDILEEVTRWGEDLKSFPFALMNITRWMTRRQMGAVLKELRRLSSSKVWCGLSNHEREVISREKRIAYHICGWDFLIAIEELALRHRYLYVWKK
jgi:hypothetical protein